MTSLNTKIGRGGIVVSDNAGKHHFTITYSPDSEFPYVLRVPESEHSEGRVVSVHKTSESAEFRALAEYIDLS